MSRIALVVVAGLLLAGAIPAEAGWLLIVFGLSLWDWLAS